MNSEHPIRCACRGCTVIHVRNQVSEGARNAHRETMCACGRTKLVYYTPTGVAYHCHHCDASLDAR